MRGGLVLAGGKSTRMQRDKALLEIGKKRMINLVLESLGQVVDEIAVAAANKEQGERLKPYIGEARLAYDEIPEFGPLAGIVAGLRVLNSNSIFIAACDMPFINPRVVELLFNQAQDCDALIPRWENGRLETLHAVYKRESMMQAAKQAIEQGKHIILAAVFKLSKVSYISIEDIKKIDPELKTLLNLNKPSDIKKIKMKINININAND
ncbi:MAG: molybdenum cofactor guanylyltransferase [Methanocellales archaeon]